MKTNWSQLRPLSKLDQLAEIIIKTAFIISEEHHVATNYVEHKGANFRVLNRKNETEFDILTRQINIEKTNYTFITKKQSGKGIAGRSLDRTCFVCKQTETSEVLVSFNSLERA